MSPVHTSALLRDVSNSIQPPNLMKMVKTENPNNLNLRTQNSVMTTTAIPRPKFTTTTTTNKATEPQSPSPMPSVVLKDSICDLSVKEDLPVGAERDVTVSFIKRGTKRGADKLRESLGFAYTAKRRKETVTYWECDKRPKDKSFRCNASVIERPAGVFRRGAQNHRLLQ
uniref:FLYWCH-type domain-containing protein n=1 Tax=Branchiostoma floridae TaxID=7739 RepID=C3XVL4_BRAFL|eukprot:XP_002612131.1 hypothetical protein BRAFLDRAFT_96073 [Branchiostoma floridae]